MNVFLVLIGLVTVILCSLKWRRVKYTKKGVPPGIMGWPIIGETTQFLRQGPDFMRAKQAKYGDLFKTHILGSPTIISMDPELNRYILMNESKGMVAGYPESMRKILGKYNIAAMYGPSHKLVRGSLISITTPTMLKSHLLPTIDHVMRTHLSNLENKVIDIQKTTKEVAFLTSLMLVNGIDSTHPLCQEYVTSYFKFAFGTISLPINFPGTTYRCGLKARKNINNMTKQLIKERRASQKSYEDMLGYLMKNEDNKYKLSDEEIVDQIITIMYSGYETVSVTTMMTLKYLHDHPKALEELREEHLEIRARKGPEDSLDWDDLKLMKFTRAVIFETSRLASIVNGVMRKTTKELELNGYIIPKGWRIYVYTREINYGSPMYSDPLIFNPWRWMENKLESHNYFLLFGGGTRLCPCKELGITEVSTFLHYFVTRYRWQIVGDDTLMKFPRVRAPNGLQFKVSPY